MTDWAGLPVGVAAADEIAHLSGLAFLEAMLDGRFPAPPICRPLTFRLVEVGDGLAIFEGEPGPHLLNPMGTVHGGWALTLIDSATGCAALTMLPAGVGYTTVETRGTLTRPIRQDQGKVLCTGRVLSRGRRIVSAEARVEDASGRMLAHGSSTLLILEANASLS